MNEKEIMEKIMEFLRKRDLEYSYDEDEPKHIGLGFNMDNKTLKLHIILQNGKVIFRLHFPFRVQTNAYPLMCMYMAAFNIGKAFSQLDIDPDDGELIMKYSYLLEGPTNFNAKDFWIYMTSLIDVAMEIYTKVAHLAVGMVSGKDRKVYKKLLEMALETLNGDFDDDRVSYGIESLQSDSVPDLSALFGKDDSDDDKEDDSDSDDEGITSDILHSMRRITSDPDFERIMRMILTEEKDKEETEKQSGKSEGVLSMFAKRDEEAEDKALGGDEDE